MSLLPVEVIRRKREGKALTFEELKQFLVPATPDYQISAWLMACYLNGNSAEEALAMTRILRESGIQYDWSEISAQRRAPLCDKHSTGGVGDKVSLVLAPLAAACGLTVPMMSGRGLGHTGGTVDKMESIPGLSVRLSQTEAESVLRETGFFMIGQSDAITPLDRRLYALRDVTSTVEEIGLITASILSKKLAEGSRSLVFDIKVGNGAFMGTPSEARKLAQSLVQVAKKNGVAARSLLTQMNEPLGYALGNSLEVLEASEWMSPEPLEFPEWWQPLQTQRDRFRSITLRLTSEMILMNGVTKTKAAAYAMMENALTSGKVWDLWLRMIRLQGGDPLLLQHPKRLFKKNSVRAVPIFSKSTGVIASIDTYGLGILLIHLKAGRSTAADAVHPNTGILWPHSVGSKIAKGSLLGTLLVDHQVTDAESSEWVERFRNCIRFQRQPKRRLPLFL